MSISFFFAFMHHVCQRYLTNFSPMTGLRFRGGTCDKSFGDRLWCSDESQV